MNSQSFEYFKVSTVAEAVAMMKDRGSGAVLLAGGTDLAVEIKENLRSPDVLIDLKGIETLREIEYDGKTLYLGAGVTFTDVIQSAVIRRDFPLLVEASMTVASRGLRNRATLVGNICSAVPCMDSAPALMVYETTVCVEGAGGSRDISILNFFRGPRKTALKPHEMVVGLRIVRPRVDHGGCYVKLQRTRGEDLAQSGVAVLALDGNHWRVAFTAVGPAPSRGGSIEDLLEGKPLSPGLLKQVRELTAAEINPITDVRATEQYRRHMTGVMVERGLKAAAERLRGEGPPVGTSLV